MWGEIRTLSVYTRSADLDELKDQLNQDPELYEQNGEKFDLEKWTTRMNTLKKDLAKEIRVKEGLDRLLAAHSNSNTKNAYYSVQEAGVIADTRAKIAYLRMQIDQLQMELNGDRGTIKLIVNFLNSSFRFIRSQRCRFSCSRLPLPTLQGRSDC